jgi:hypothetical protein
MALRCNDRFSLHRINMGQRNISLPTLYFAYSPAFLNMLLVTNTGAEQDQEDS